MSKQGANQAKLNLENQGFWGFFFIIFIFFFTILRIKSYSFTPKKILHSQILKKKIKKITILPKRKYLKL